MLVCAGVTWCVMGGYAEWEAEASGFLGGKNDKGPA